MTLVVEAVGTTIPYFEKLRDGDEAECAIIGLSPHEAISQCIRLSLLNFSATVDGEALAFWGYRPITILGNSCQMWLFSTPLVEKHKVLFARETARHLAQALHHWGEITVLVDLRYERAVKWLRWLGFLPKGSNGPFVVMAINRGDF